MNQKERARREQRARHWAVKGWAFRDLSAEEQQAIEAFLEGGDCPAGYHTQYTLAREQLGLEGTPPGNSGVE